MNLTRDGRSWLLAGAICAAAFFVLAQGPTNGAAAIALKGLSVALLAAFALARAEGADGRLLTGIMLLSAAGDVGIELDQVVGGVLFLLSHVAAIVLYMRNRRVRTTPSQRAAGAALLILVPLLAWLLSGALVTIVYGLALGGMAAAAWTSRFGRYRVGLGALLFVASDLLIFARLGGWIEPATTGWLVWPLYYLGQAMICTGVVRTLRVGKT